MADYAELVFDIDSSSARSAAKDLLGLEAAAGRMSRELGSTGAAFNSATGKWEATLRRSNGQFKTAQETAAEYGREMEQLAVKYNPVMAATLAYTKMQEELGRAVAFGVVTQARADSQLSAAATRMGAFGTAAQTSTHHVSNLSFQINDIAMMMASGQNPFTLMIQQGPQVAQIFSQMKQQGQGIGPTIRAAFEMILNPMTAITLVAIGGAAAVTQLGASLLGGGKDAKSFVDAVDAAESAISKINKTTSAYSETGLEEVYAKYGKITSEVRQLIEQERLLAKLEGTKALNDMLGSIAGSLGAGVFTTAYGELSNVFKVSANEAQVLYGVIKGIGGLDSIDKQLFTVTKLRDQLALVTNNFTKMTPEQQNMLDYLTKSESMIQQILSSSGALPGKFGAAAAAAAKITDELNRAVGAAGRLASAGLDEVATAQINLQYRTDPVGRAGAMAALKFEQEVVDQIAKSGGKIAADERDYIAQKREETIARAKNAAAITLEVEKLNKADADAERAAKSAASKGAAELKAAQTKFQSLRELLEKDSLFEVAEYEKRQSQLDLALSKNLLSLENYELLKKELKTMYFGSEYEQNTLNYQMNLEQLDLFHEQGLLKESDYLLRKKQLNAEYADALLAGGDSLLAQDLNRMSQGFGQMNQLAGGGYAKLLKAQQVFAASAALISTLTGAAKALELPFPENMIAMGKVMAAGMGLVNAIKGGGNGGSAAGGSSAATTTAAKAEPDKNVYLHFEGDDWMTQMMESLAKQLYEQTGNGRIIVNRG